MDFSNLTDVSTFEGAVFAGVLAGLISGFILGFFTGKKTSKKSNIKNKGDQNTFNVNKD
ncbi:MULTISPECIES: hypothetical protein [Bacillaceae]|uniref:hypothetical protein n=1 Tax=Bacillaceae TaxID=186817 RepID=UPI00159B8F36|nr:MULTISPECIES: hypothetical protein [Bacillaceae]UGB30664.1 hypothetical protein LPC09_23700 [Metabacillus sp. B2-18]